MGINESVSAEHLVGVYCPGYRSCWLTVAFQFKEVKMSIALVTVDASHYGVDGSRL